MTAPEMYEAMVRFLHESGWRREEPQSGWWWKEGQDDCRIGEAVETELDLAGLDLRVQLHGEPQEFWSPMT